MEYLGEKLKSTREGKDIDLDQASKDTKISLRYLKALENEDFSGFPGETYITGFLKNYGNYLDLDVQELLSLYKALKMQEQPIPVEQLLKSPSVLPKIMIFATVILVLGGIGAGTFFWINRPEKPKADVHAVKGPVEYTMSGDNFEHRFYVGDSILIPVVSADSAVDHIKLELTNLGEAVTIQTPDGPVILDLSQEAHVDIDRNSMASLRINAIDYAKNNADVGVQLRFVMSSLAMMENLPTEMTATSGHSASTVIFNSSNPYPFTLQSSFQGYCMFRWEILMERDRRERNQRYFQRTDELSIQAQNGIRIWASNAQSAKFQVIGGGRTVPVEIGGAGEVVVVDIRWVRDDDNRFRLIVARLET